MWLIKGFTRFIICWLGVGLGCLLASFQPALANDAEPPVLTLAGAPPTADFTDLSLDELLAMQVTSVSKHPEPLSSAAAAITVLTRDDIRRSGATSIPDLLRLVPGVQVARLNTGHYAISIRGFDDLFANKMLVLRDGRSLYSPLNSGVFWRMHDPLIEDLERIEVIRGPGGTLWGANAVNGVINLITRSARDSQGGLLTLGGGLEEEAMMGLRYGGQVSADTWFKVYGTAHQRDAGLLADGEDGGDDLSSGSFGLRLEKEMAGSDVLSLQLDRFSATSEGQFLWPVLGNEVNVLTHERFIYEGGAASLGWRRHLGEGEHLRLDLFYEYDESRNPLLSQNLHQTALEFEHAWHLTDRQLVVWGLGTRVYRDEITDSSLLRVTDHERQWAIYSAFMQDEITLIPDKLKLTVGTKVEHHEFTGVEWQPSLRLAFTPHQRHTWWAAVSRAVRTPSRVNTDLAATVLGIQRPPPLGPLGVLAFGNEDYASEELLAWETGYRVRLGPALTLETALFYNQYDKLQTVRQLTSAPPSFELTNNGYGESYGGEFSGIWQVTEEWRLQLGYGHSRLALHQHAGYQDLGFELQEGQTARNQAILRSSLTLSPAWELDLGLRFVDTLSSLDVPSYLTADLRLGWRPRANLRLDLILQHLGDRSRPEFAPTNVARYLQTSEIEPSVFLKLTYTF